MRAAALPVVPVCFCFVCFRTCALRPDHRAPLLACAVPQTEVYRVSHNGIASALFELGERSTAAPEEGVSGEESSFPSSIPRSASSFVRGSSSASLLANAGDADTASSELEAAPIHACERKPTGLRSTTPTGLRSTPTHRPGKMREHPEQPPPAPSTLTASTPTGKSGKQEKRFSVGLGDMKGIAAARGGHSGGPNPRTPAIAADTSKAERERRWSAPHTVPTLCRQSSTNGQVARLSRQDSTNTRRLSRQDSNAEPALSRPNSQLNSLASRMLARAPSNASLWSTRSVEHEHSSHTTADPLFEIAPLMLLSDCKCDVGGISLKPYGTDGAVLAVAGGNHVRVLDLHSGTSLRTTCYTADARARCVALSSDGCFVLSGHFDKWVRLHYMMAGCTASSFGVDGPATRIRSVHLTSDSRLLATGSDQRGFGLVQIFDVATNALVASWRTPAVVETVRFSPDGSLLGVCSLGTPLALYSAASPNELLFQLPLLAQAGGAVPNLWRFGWSGDGAMLAVTSLDGKPDTVGIFQVEGLATAPSATAGVAGAFESTCPRTNGDRTDDGMASCAPRSALKQVNEGAEALHIPYDGARKVASVGLRLSLRIEYSASVYCLALDRTGEHCVVGGKERSVALYRTAGGNVGGGAAQRLWVTEHPDATRIYAVALTADRSYCCFGGLGRSLCVASGHTGQRIFSIAAEGRLDCLALLEAADGDSGNARGPCVALSGDFETTFLLDLKQRQVTHQCA